MPLDCASQLSAIGLSQSVQVRYLDKSRNASACESELPPSLVQEYSPFGFEQGNSCRLPGHGRGMRIADRVLMFDPCHGLVPEQASVIVKT